MASLPPPPPAPTVPSDEESDDGKEKKKKPSGSSRKGKQKGASVADKPDQVGSARVSLIFLFLCRSRPGPGGAVRALLREGLSLLRPRRSECEGVLRLRS